MRSCTKTHRQDFRDAMAMFGFVKLDTISDRESYQYCITSDTGTERITCSYGQNGTIYTRVYADSIQPRLASSLSCTRNINQLVSFIDRRIDSANVAICSAVCLPASSSYITASKTTREMLKSLVKVKSSNIWGIAISIKQNGDRYGDVIVQFKGRQGQPDDVYQYFDVPVQLFRRWVNAPSKGHFFWQYIRNRFKYRKLTGSKRGVLPNAVN